MRSEADYTNRISNIRNEKGRAVEIHPVKTRRATPEEIERYFGAAEKKYGNAPEKKPSFVGRDSEEDVNRKQVDAIVRKCSMVSREDWEDCRLAVDLVGLVNGWK